MVYSPLMNFDPAVFGQAFAQALALGMKAVTPGTPSTNLMYGSPVPGATAGFFGVCGLNDTLINASVGPRGIESLLPSYGTDITNPEFAILTGFEQVAGQTEPTGACGDCIIMESEGCILTAQFGKICRGSKEIALTEINTRRTPGENRLRLFGDVTGPDGRPIPGAGHGTLINDEREWAMVEAAVGLQRALQPMVFQGNPANNVGQGYWEFPGFDLLIGTGKVDAHTGVTCPAADSDIKSFGYRLVDGSDGGDIVGIISMMEAYLYYNSTRMGLDPCEWVLAMRGELWYQLSDVWPVSYNTQRAGIANANAEIVVDGMGLIAQRDAMRSGMYLDVNGRRLRVIIDDGIAESTNVNDANVPAGSWASDIYFIPLRVRGTAVTYFEYQDFSMTLKGIAQNALNDANAQVWITDGGRFFVDRTYTNRCYHTNVMTKPRLILRTPQLAGRIQDVRYNPLQHFREPIDQNSPYFYKGGAARRTAGTNYSEWNLPQ